VHFEPLDSGIAVRLRVDGALGTVAELPAELAAQTVARLKVLAGLATYRTEVPQDGRIPREGGADLRLATYPTVRGEKAVVRLFARRAEDFRLAALDLPEEVRASLEEALECRDGLVVLTGPAGSGKTTTIYAALQRIAEEGGESRQVVTVEDPVECLLPGATQTEVNPPAGLTFANCLRSVLRQDPEVIMVGEVRDSQTAALAVEAALTGHLVITTLHAGTAAGVFARLLEMGVEPHMITGVLKLAVAQRLVRRSCGNCAGKGCADCAGSGLRGRIPIAEALGMTPALRAAVLAGGDLAALRAAAGEGGAVSLRERGRELVAAGATTEAEVQRALAGLEGDAG
jgi:type II secretory ATPase GspE/PulE/Tfp pilus assembly ATPase PilB-like protein